MALTSAAIARKAEAQQIPSKAAEEFYIVEWQVSGATTRKMPTTILSLPIDLKGSSSGTVLARAGRRVRPKSFGESGLQALKWTASAVEGLQQGGKHKCMIVSPSKECCCMHCEGAHKLTQCMTAEAVRATLRTACLEDVHIQKLIQAETTPAESDRNIHRAAVNIRNTVDLTPR